MKEGLLLHLLEAVSPHISVILLVQASPSVQSSNDYIDEDNRNHSYKYSNTDDIISNCSNSKIRWRVRSKGCSTFTFSAIHLLIVATIAFRHDGSRALYLVRDGSSNLSPISGIDNDNGNNSDKYSSGCNDGIYIYIYLYSILWDITHLGRWQLSQCDQHTLQTVY